jgi:hypothetical protein
MPEVKMTAEDEQYVWRLVKDNVPSQVKDLKAALAVLHPEMVNRLDSAASVMLRALIPVALTIRDQIAPHLSATPCGENRDLLDGIHDALLPLDGISPAGVEFHEMVETCWPGEDGGAKRRAWGIWPNVRADIFAPLYVAHYTEEAVNA